MRMLEIILASLFIMTASLAGVFFVWQRAGKFISDNLSFLVSFSAGVFLVISFNLLIEAMEHGGVIDGIIWLFVGVFSLFFLFKILPSFHHHHDEKEEPHLHSHVDAKNILVGDGIHNVADGVLLAAAFAVNFGLGIITTLSIFIHELVQGTSEFFVLKQAGYSTKKALLTIYAISSTILIGTLGGFYFLKVFESLEVAILGIASGAFLTVVFHDLVPHSIRHSKHKVAYHIHFMWFLIGAVIMYSVSLLGQH